jgi:hypothetical protein
MNAANKDTTPTINRIKNVISEFEKLKSAQQGRRLQEMAKFLSDFDLLTVRTGMQRPWNVFTLLNVESDEVRHSRFLAWLLSPRSGHGQGTTFLEAFVDLCGLDVPTHGLERARVRTEFSGIESIVDIMVYQKGRFLIYIENKVFAGEGPNQIDREYRDLQSVGRSLNIPEQRRFAVFLSPDGRRPISGDASRWIAVSYRDVASSFASLVSAITSPKTNAILCDWIETVRTFGGNYDYVF